MHIFSLTAAESCKNNIAAINSKEDPEESCILEKGCNIGNKFSIGKKIGHEIRLSINASEQLLMWLLPLMQSGSWGKS